MSRGLGYAQKKIILALAGGVFLGLSGTPKQYFRLLKGLREEWAHLSSRQLHEATYSLYEAGLVKVLENEDGTVSIVLSEKGKEATLRYDPENLSIDHSEKWDGKWRVVLFDIPEKKRQVRDAFRERMNALEFFEYQKSVFVLPYDCRKEIKFLVEHFEIKSYVRFMIVESMDNELALRKHFKLS